MVEASTRSDIGGFTRWGQLVLGIVCMVAIANMQYGWTLFIHPIEQKYGWGTAALQTSFAIGIATETFVAVPLAGRLVDRFGPKLAAIGGPLIAMAWYINSIADALSWFYVAAMLSGFGTGLVFATTAGNVVRLFPDRRGFAAGLTAAGFAGGGLVTVVPLANMIQSSGYEAAYLWFGIGQGFVVLVCALLLRAPRSGELSALAPPLLAQAKYDSAPRETVTSRPFWLMYAMFVMVGAGGLMLQAQLAPIARYLAIDQVRVSFLGLSLLVPALALLVLAVTNAMSRPIFGWVSDRIGREQTMFIAFMLEAFAFALLSLANTPLLFVACVALVFFAWGQIFALFLSICTDTYGGKFASANYGMLYTAKGTASLFVPLASVLNEATGSWTAVFAVAAALNVVAAILALPVLKRARMQVMAKQG